MIIEIISLVKFYIFPVLREFHEKTKTNNELIQLDVCKSIQSLHLSPLCF